MKFPPSKINQALQQYKATVDELSTALKFSNHSYLHTWMNGRSRISSIDAEKMHKLKVLLDIFSTPEDFVLHFLPQKKVGTPD